MKREHFVFDAFFKAIIISIALPVLLVLSSSAPALAQPRRSGQSRQLQQREPIVTLPTRAKRFALIVGVDDYEDTQITTLGGATNDARAVADAIVRYAGFPADQVILLASDQPTERQPTRGNILRRLSNLRGIVPQDGMLLVAFAGHGIERAGQAYLLPSDAQVSGDIRLLEETAINVTRMKEAIKETKVGQVMLILDACRNDPAGRANVDNPLTPAYTRGFDFDVRNREVTAFATLYATAVGQRAYEFKEKRQGYFTWELVEALKGGAANEKGEVTLDSLVKYLQEQVPRHVRIDLGKEQRPFAIIEGFKADELVVAVRGQGSSGLSTNTSPAPSTDTAAADVVIWDAIKNSTNPQDFKEYIKQFPNGRYTVQARRRLNNLEAEARNRADNPETSLASPLAANRSLTISTVSVVILSYVGPDFPALLYIGGSGWDGGSEIKVVVNDQAVSAGINRQVEGLISLKGTVKELNLRDGRNEVALILNGVTSNTYVFKQAIESPEANSSARAAQPDVAINHAGYVNRNGISGMTVFYKALQDIRGAQDIQSSVKVFINGKDMSTRINAGGRGVIMMRGNARQLNLQGGKNEVYIIVKGITSNTYTFQADIE
jgi:hypothetical protein